MSASESTGFAGGGGDWSRLPTDLYVTGVQTSDGIVFDVTMCSVPMAIGPEVRYSRAEAHPRCEHCDGTGDVHSIDGEWRGRCSCPIGEATEAAHKEAIALAERAGIDMMDDHHLFLKDMTDTLLRFAALSAPLGSTGRSLADANQKDQP